MEQTFVIIAKAVNVFETLQRIASLMSRNRLAMQQFNIMHIGADGVAHMSLALRTDEETVEKFMKKLMNFTDLLEININTKTK